MPLEKSASRAAIGRNISEMENAGHSHAQSVAAALHTADEAKRAHLASGGFPGISKAPMGIDAKPAAGLARHPMVPRVHLAGGGMDALSGSSTPFYVRQEARELYSQDQYHPGGLFNSDVAGRTDRLPRAVAADSFVMPADVVAGLGQGNTMAGAKILDAAMSTGPFGTNLPRPSGIRKFADGGHTGVSHVMVAGGEYLINRKQLEWIGARRRQAKMSKARSDLAAGHEWARELVDKVRKQQKKFLATAPDPKK